jgi:hypothetical protein
VRDADDKSVPSRTRAFHLLLLFDERREVQRERGYGSASAKIE